MTNDSFRKEFFAAADRASSIVITSHISPDDDSIGSVLSMYAILSAKYPQKNIRVVYTGTAVERYRSFFNFDKIEWVDDVANHLDGADMLIGLDASQYGRYSKEPAALQEVPVTVAIDHHASEPSIFTLSLIQPDRTSNSEIIFRTFLHDSDYSKELAELILLGILGDTGGFAYVRPDQADVLTIGAVLVERIGVSIDTFRSRYMGIPVHIIPLLQALVANTRYDTIGSWSPVQYAHIDRSVLDQGGYSDEDMSAASHIYLSQYVSKVQGYPWGFVVTPRVDGSCRVSSRSLPGSTNVRLLHEALGIGSGHDRASGGTFADVREPAECIERMLDFLKNHEPLG